MQVTIIFEELNLFSLGLSASSRKSIRKSLKLRVSKNLQIYSIAILLGVVCLFIKWFVVGGVILTVSTLWFWLVSFFQNAYSTEIKFSVEDTLEEIIKEDLYD